MNSTTDCAFLVMIGFLVLRFTAHHDTLWADLKHPVVGSIVPTFAMCLMVVSKTAGHWMPEAGVVLWCAAVLLHLAALGIFVVNRLQEPRLELMVPSWFVPPIGIVVADVTFPEVVFLLTCYYKTEFCCKINQNPLKNCNIMNSF